MDQIEVLDGARLDFLFFATEQPLWSVSFLVENAKSSQNSID